MSGQVSRWIGGLEFTIDSKDGLCIENTSNEGNWVSLQDAYKLVEWLQDNLPEREHARSTLRPFLDRSTT